MNNRLINTKVAGGGGCTDIVDNYDPFGGGGVALYQLNGDATDVSGNYDGTASNVTYGAGQFGQAGVFNGSSSYISTSNPFGTGNVSYSISAWIYLNASSHTGGIYCIWNGGTTSGTYIFFKVEGGKISIGNYGGSVTSVNTLPVGQWIHVVATRETNNNVILYVNGASDTTGSFSLNLGNHSAKIGALNTSVQNFNGSIDQVRIFNTALTPLEVEALYTEELCICDGTVDTLDILGDGSCIATYQLDGNANDLSGNYSGTPTDVSYGVGEFDLAGVFNGSPSVITIPRNNILDMNHNKSFSAWINVSDLTQTNVIAGQGKISFTDGWYLALRPSPLEISFASDYGSVFDVRTTNTMVENTWYHIVAINTGSKLQVYLNGSIVIDSNANTGNLNSTNGDFTIGKYPHAAGYFYGSIDQVRIFNKALSAGEVTTLYNETACTKVACTGTTHTLNILGGGDTSCIAAYPLDGSPADLSGNYNGVQTDVTYPQGYFDLAGSFSGSRIQANNVTGFPSGNAARSASVWVKMEAAPISGAILMWGTGASNQAFVLYPNGTELNIATYGAPVATGYNFTLNQWTHIVVTHDGTTTKVYADNVLVDSFNYTYNTATNSFVIGNVAWAEEPFQGDLDQVRIFNKALSAGEVTTLYNETPCN